MIRLEHIRAMFLARKVAGGQAFADAVFKAALQATNTKAVSPSPSPTVSPITTPTKTVGSNQAETPPVTPSQAEWNQRMGDLLPRDSSLGMNPSLSASLSETLNESIDLNNEGILFPQFRRAVAALPILVDVMLAESKSQALSVLGKSTSTSTPIVDSVIEEERGSLKP
mmetsp:Transcript_49467/g.63440  ORF Transcript_49467/g.63440 Transcript_49467/m.63440 type:complete len:169 (+) Transcript_49467:1269-1775(+)